MKEIRKQKRRKFFVLFRWVLMFFLYLWHVKISNIIISKSYTMANKRDLKRALSNSCGVLFTESVTAYLSVNNDDIEQVDAILTSIMKTHREFLNRVSHPEPGMKAKKYYRILIDDFNKRIGEIIDNIQALS